MRSLVFIAAPFYLLGSAAATKFVLLAKFHIHSVRLVQGFPCCKIVTSVDKSIFENGNRFDFECLALRGMSFIHIFFIRNFLFLF